MRILLIDPKIKSPHNINKDLAGGLGTATRIGSSPRARLLLWVNKKSINLPVLDMAYIAAILKGKGYQVSFSESYSETPCDAVVLYSTIVQCKTDRELLLKYRRKGIKTVVVGNFPSTSPEFYEGCADAIVRGPVEGAFMQLDVENMSGRVPSPVVNDLDRLPFPDWDLFPISRYSYWHVLARKPFVTVSGSRGCPFSCSYYCPYTSVEGTRFRYRSAENVVSELIYLDRRYGIRAVLFRDPIFSLRKDRIFEMCQLIRRLGLQRRIHWACETRLDALSRELLEEMYSAGLRALNFGVESGDPDVLKAAKRKEYRHDFAMNMIQQCHRLRIRTSAFFIMAYPTDTAGSVKRMIDYAIQLNPDRARFAVYTPYPGTPYFQNGRPEIVDDDWEHFSEFNLVFKHSNLTPSEVDRLLERAYLKFYYRPEVIGKLVTHFAGYVFRALDVKRWLHGARQGRGAGREAFLEGGEAPRW